MIDLLTTTLLRAYGPSPRLLRAKFDGAAATTMTLAEQFGIKSVVQTGTTTGIWDVTLQNKYAEWAPYVWTTGDSARIHDTPITTINFSTGVFRFSHFQSASAARVVPDTASNGASPAVTFHILVIARGSL